MRPFLQRYPPTYRSAEVQLIARFARGGKSCAFMGVAGVGKSNLLEFLRHHYRPPDPNAPDILYVSIDCNDWDGTEEGFWRLMLTEIWHDLDLGNNGFRHVLTADDPHLEVRELVKRQCCHQDQRLVFVLDDCDRLLAQGPLELLEALDTLRDYHRDRLGYLLFVKRLPHLLGKKLHLRESSDFYKLFGARIYTLKPYAIADALHTLRYLDERDGARCSVAEHRVIHHICGGHARLLASVHETYDSVREMTTEERLKRLASEPAIRLACEAIIRSLHDHERDALIRFVRRSPEKEGDEHALNLLHKRGLLVGRPAQLFSPLLRTYLLEGQRSV